MIVEGVMFVVTRCLGPNLPGTFACCALMAMCLALLRCGGVVEPGAPGDCWVQSEQADDGTGRVTKGPAPSPDAKACDAPITCAAKLASVRERPDVRERLRASQGDRHRRATDRDRCVRNGQMPLT